MSKADVMKLEMTTEGGMEGYINKIINERNQKEIVKLFCDIIEMSYGIKTLDGAWRSSISFLTPTSVSCASSSLKASGTLSSSLPMKTRNGVSTPKRQNGV